MRLLALLALLAGSAIYHASKNVRQEEPELPKFRPREDLGRGYDVWQEGNDLRMRGSFQDIMATLNPAAYPPPPPLPSDLDTANLPKYYGGCPHCGATSMFGENQWRYHELERSRGYGDNTTTFLAKCQKCLGFMRATVDHDD